MKEKVKALTDKNLRAMLDEIYNFKYVDGALKEDSVLRQFAKDNGITVHDVEPYILDEGAVRYSDVVLTFMVMHPELFLAVNKKYEFWHPCFPYKELELDGFDVKTISDEDVRACLILYGDHALNFGDHLNTVFPSIEVIRKKTKYSLTAYGLQVLREAFRRYKKIVTLLMDTRSYKFLKF